MMRLQPTLLLIASFACAPPEREAPADAGPVEDAGLECEDFDVEVPTCDFTLDEREEGELLSFVTSGCWTIKVDHHTITVTDWLERNTVQTWGHPHENLNGKHVKDWLGTRRTLLFPGRDGDVILTMDATGPHGVVTRTSIYDDGKIRVIANDTNTLTFSSDDPSVVAAHEAAEADGETARITPLRCEVVSWDNEYTQEEDDTGAPLEKEPTPAPLGTTGGTRNPRQVNDLYDDPRLAHT